MVLNMDLYSHPNYAKYLTLAAEALEQVYRDQPALTANGMQMYVPRYRAAATIQVAFRRQRDVMHQYLDQIATALAYIDVNEIIKTPRFGSYGLKHDAERWGNVNGYAPYVCNGALIVAALFRKVPYRYVGGPNCAFALGVKTWRRLDEETRACLNRSAKVKVRA